MDGSIRWPRAIFVLKRDAFRHGTGDIILIVNDGAFESQRLDGCEHGRQSKLWRLEVVTLQVDRNVMEVASASVIKGEAERMVDHQDTDRQ